MLCYQLWSICSHNISYQFNRSENCERIMITSVQSLNIQLSRVLFPGLHVWPNLGCYRLFKCRFRFWSITRNEIVLSSMLRVSSKEFCSGVTCPCLMKEDFFRLRILHENSLWLSFYFLFVMICGFSVFRIFPRGNEGKC